MIKRAFRSGLLTETHNSRICADLTQPQTLSFGLVTHVTDKGLIAGLDGLRYLQRLQLFDVSSITDVTIETVMPQLRALQFLSLSKCHGLTNKGLESLAR